jgi:hypothetical protein
MCFDFLQAGTNWKHSPFNILRKAAFYLLVDQFKILHDFFHCHSSS